MRFYTAQLECISEVPSASNPDKMRAATCADAAKVDGLPSVTQVQKDMGAKQSIVDYQINQVAVAGWETQKEGMEQSAWIKEVKEKGREHAKLASDRGTLLHDEVSRYFKTGQMPFDPTAEYAVKTFEKEFPGIQWETESGFYNKKRGWAGRSDLHSVSTPIVVDMKFRTSHEAPRYYGDGEQLGAYRLGHELPDDTALISAIFTADGGGVGHKFYRWGEGRSRKPLDLSRSFELAFERWTIIKNYDPRIKAE